MTPHGAPRLGALRDRATRGATVHQIRRMNGWLAGYVLASSCALVLAIRALAHGAFVYSLDDPYIHLALARVIAQGGYGINAGMAASPSSSILWPLFLAPFADTALGEIVPLLINVACAIRTALVLAAGLRRLLPPRIATVAAAVAVSLLNVIGVAFTGMEHSLQVLLAALATHAVLVIKDTRIVPPWLPAVMVVGPLVRYELLALTAALAIVLVRIHRWRLALLTCVLAIIPVAAFSAFLMGLGLDPIPSSILIKSDMTGVHTLTQAGAVLVNRLHAAAVNPVFLAALAVTVIDVFRTRRVDLVQGYVLTVLALHAVAGQFGWWGRYEVYLAVAVAVPVLSFVRAWSTTRAWRGIRIAALVVLLLAPLKLFATTVATPLAAREIYLQQAQTARLVSDYWRAPIAVNDLGLVAYRGDQVTVDLWGLGDGEARIMRFEGEPGWMQQLVNQRHVRLVAVYAAWFPDDIPASWTEVARLQTPGLVAVAGSVVSYYAVSPTDVADACTAIQGWKATLPAQDSVTTSCPEATITS